MKVIFDGVEKNVDPGMIKELLRQSGKASSPDDSVGVLDHINNHDCPLVNIVEIDGRIHTAFSIKGKQLKEGMKINTNSSKIREELEKRVDFLLKKHECLIIRNAQEFVACEAASGNKVDLEERKNWDWEERVSEPSILHDPNKCIRCGSCVEACDAQSVGALTMDEKDGVVIDGDKCVRCGQCIINCPFGYREKHMDLLVDWMGCGMCAFSRPVGAFTEKDDVQKVIDALKNPEIYTTVQFAPSIRATIGEDFGALPGEVLTQKLYGALRKLGFDRVWDTNFSADLTIMEEGTELIGRITNGGVLPQFTSCCPGWINFAEKNYPSLIPNMSTAKSPQQMFGSLAKTYGAERLDINPGKMFVVSIMPCTAKKYESERMEFKDAKEYWNKKDNQTEPMNDVDVVLTTRECSKLLKMFGINLLDMPEESADSMLSEYTGAAPIFGRTGGVMTAALRTAYEVIQGEEIGDLNLESLGAYEGIKTAAVETVAGEVRVAVASGLGNAKQICESIINNEEFSKYHFIEIMACPGGCIAGGGQIVTPVIDKKKARAAGLNKDDQEECHIRKSHENKEVQELYETFLGKPCDTLSHHLLHTKYFAQNKEK